jgi:hypothetical protein
MSRVMTHTAIDGSQVVFKGEDEISLDEPFNSYIVAAGGGIQTELTTGVAGFAEHFATRLHRVELNEEYAYGGRPLLMGSRQQRLSDGTLTLPLRTIVWKGRYSSLLTHCYAKGATETLAFLNLFEFREDQSGLAIVPKRRDAVALSRGPRFTKLVPGVGLFNVKPRTKDQNRNLPPWRGTPVRGGELFRDDASGGPLVSLLTPSARVDVMTVSHPSYAVGLDTAVDRLSRVEVAWQPR